MPADETRSPASSEEDDASSPPKEETIRTVTIPCVRPIRVAFALERHPPKEPRVELLDLAAFEEDAFEKEGEVVLTAKFELIGAWDLEVESVEWHVGVSRCENWMQSGMMMAGRAGTDAPTLPCYTVGDSPCEEHVLVARCWSCVPTRSV